MRNLLGRLNARPAEDLQRIALFWQIPLGSGDRLTQIAALYRVLTDPRAVRDTWDRLAPDEQALIQFLALGRPDEISPTLAELAAHLELPESEVRDTAVRLYRIGVLARERDDEELPVGELPRLFLPREIAQLVRRRQDEIEAGDLSQTPLRALWELLDDTEIEEAAAIWSINVVPGLRDRADLTRQLLQQMSDPSRVGRVAAARSRDGQHLWRRVREEPGGAPVALTTALADTGLVATDARSAQRQRAALADLESSLLLWHTFHADGSRWLFAPAEFRLPGRSLATTLPPLAPVNAGDLVTPSWRPSDALAWDLLTLLRELTDPDAPPWPATGDPPRSRLRRLNQRFWHRADDTPPPGYVELLLALAEADGLVQRDDGHHATFTIGPGARRWRDQSFAAQSERLRWWWLAATDWVEGRSLGEVEVWGADWRGARRRLLTLLGDPTIGLAPATWVTLDSVAARIAAHDPTLLGSTVTVAMARQAPPIEPGIGDNPARQAAVAEVVRIALATAFAWFGLVELADVPGHTRALRVTDAGLAASRRQSPPSVTPAPTAKSDPPLTINADGAISLREPTPLRVWSLSAFADLERLERIAVYRLTAEALARALAAGFDLEQVTTFLAKQADQPVPATVAAKLREWALAVRRVRLRRAIVVSPDDVDSLPEITRLLAEANLPIRQIGERELLVELPVPPIDQQNDHVTELLRNHGLSPRWSSPGAPAVTQDPTVSPRSTRERNSSTTAK